MLHGRLGGLIGEAMGDGDKDRARRLFAEWAKCSPDMALEAFKFYSEIVGLATERLTQGPAPRNDEEADRALVRIAAICEGATLITRGVFDLGLEGESSGHSDLEGEEP